MALCKACGNSTGFSLLKRFVPDEEGRQHTICKSCLDAAIRDGKYLKYDPKTDRVYAMSKGDAEIRKKCRVCGHIMCYTELDMLQNKQAAQSAKLSAVTSMGNILTGEHAAAAVNQANANTQVNQIKDYNRCPKCASMDLIRLSKDEYEHELQKANNPQPAISPADELKKFKELLDMGIITQDEFDAKKKQLLGL